MLKDKKLQKIVKKLFKNTITGGKISGAKITNLLKSFKKLPSHQAIAATSFLLEEVKRNEAQTTLTIEAATPLSSVEIKKITKSLNTKYLILNTKYQPNPSLLGGIKVRIGDVLFDNSVLSKLEQVKGVIKNG